MLQSILKLADLAAFDAGIVDVLFSDEMRRLVADLMDRPKVASARKVSVVVMVTPVVDQRGNVCEAKVEIEVNGSLPKVRTRTYTASVAPSGLKYNDLSREDVRQQTLPLDDQPDGGKPE